MEDLIRKTVTVNFSNIEITAEGLYRKKDDDFEFINIIWEGKNILTLFNVMFHSHIEELEAEIVKAIKSGKDKKKSKYKHITIKVCNDELDSLEDYLVVDFFADDELRREKCRKKSIGVWGKLVKEWDKS